MRPIIGITMGDPAGCGPELSVKAFSDPNLYEKCRPLLVGDAKVLQASLDMLESPLKVHAVHEVRDCLFEYGTIDIYDLGIINMESFEKCQVSAQCGEAGFKYVEKVIQLAMAKEIDATVTNAINKEALNLAGHHFSGHTEIYAEYTNTKKYTMMLAHDDLRVVHVSTHVSLREACDRVKKDRVLEVIRIANKACLDLGIKNPKVGVAGLNPHSGENGLFGREELDEIMPAIEEAKNEGINATGPVPPDSLFSKAIGGWFDIVVAMYHDQGHIPLKVVGFVFDREKGIWKDVSGVNITLGIPIIRTSVDHGTAFDCAWRGVQTPVSLNNAIDYAVKLAENRGNKE